MTVESCADQSMRGRRGRARVAARAADDLGDSRALRVARTPRRRGQLGRRARATRARRAARVDPVRQARAAPVALAVIAQSIDAQPDAAKVEAERAAAVRALRRGRERGREPRRALGCSDELVARERAASMRRGNLVVGGSVGGVVGRVPRAAAPGARSRRAHQALAAARAAGRTRRCGPRRAAPRGGERGRRVSSARHTHTPTHTASATPRERAPRAPLSRRRRARQTPRTRRADRRRCARAARALVEQLRRSRVPPNVFSAAVVARCGRRPPALAGSGRRRGSTNATPHPTARARAARRVIRAARLEHARAPRAQRDARAVLGGRGLAERRDGPLRLAAVRRRRGGRREDREGTDQQVQHFCEHTATAMGFSVDGERRPACVLRLKTMLARLHASLKIHS